MNMSRIRWGLAALAVAALAACGGGGGDATPTTTPTPTPDVPVAVPTGTSPVTLTENTPPATFAALQFKLNVGRVTIAGAPVVDFSMTDLDGNPIVGFGRTSQNATALKASYPNLSFALAKLVPGANGSPSKWVSYIVSTAPTKTTASVPNGPTTDNIGTLVDHKNGTYTYTFSEFRDVTKMKAFVSDNAASQAALPTPKLVADLGDLTFDPNLTHRLVVIASGNAPGTGTNTPNAVQVVPGVPMANPANVVYDFIPATGKPVTATDTQRLVVDKASCNECHGKLGGIPGTETSSFHGGARFDPQVCNVCHTDQRKFGATNLASVVSGTTIAFPLSGTPPAPKSTALADGVSVGDLPIMVHKIHMGVELAKKNYNFGGVLFNETKYPQDIRNCTKCHDNSATALHPTAQGNNWNTVPSQMACGACHDGMNFKTGTGLTLADAAAGLTASTNPHPGVGPLPDINGKADDSQCARCHDTTAIKLFHLPVTPPNPLNSLDTAGASANNNTAAAFIAGNTKNLPAGAILVSYDIKSVNVDPTTGRPSITFLMKQNGAAVAFNDPAAKSEMWDNFVGSPSVYFVFAVPQDGIAKPADFNASVSGYLRNIWNGTATVGTGAGTISARDATTGYYTVTLTGVSIPANAVMVTGGLGYTYGLTGTQPLTQTNLSAYPAVAGLQGFKSTKPGDVATVNASNGSTVIATPTGPVLLSGGLIVATQDATLVGTRGTAKYTGRRTIVADGKCDKCHEQLGVFTAESFHAGQRNDGASCSWCHTPNRTSSAWSADSAYFVHAIHAGGKRTTPFTWHAAKVGESFANVGFPGVLSNCEACHVAGSYDFSGSANASAVPNRLYRTVATGKFNGASTNAVSNFSLSPYVVADNVTDYGSGFSFRPDTQVTVEAAATTRVVSPITTACFSCHDSSQALAHMQSTGGQIYAPRGTAGTFGAPGNGALGALASGNGEACLVCHGTGKEFDIKKVHPAVVQ